MKTDKSEPTTPEAPAKPKTRTMTDAMDAPDPATLDGLYLAGTVNGRQRRAFAKKGGGQRYAITLSVLTGSGLFKPERWCDSPAPTDTPRVGEHVCLPVTMQYYTTRTGTAVRLVWGESTQGEQF